MAVILTLVLAMALAGAAFWLQRKRKPAAALPPPSPFIGDTARTAFVAAQWTRAGIDPARLSAYSHTLARDAELAFEAGADIAAVLMAQAAMEAHLRYELHLDDTNDAGFLDLIERLHLPRDLETDLHRVRRYRNRWSHVADPRDDHDLSRRPDHHADEAEAMARKAITAMTRILALDLPDRRAA